MRISEIITHAFFVTLFAASMMLLASITIKFMVIQDLIKCVN